MREKSGGSSLVITMCWDVDSEGKVTVPTLTFGVLYSLGVSLRSLPCCDSSLVQTALGTGRPFGYYQVPLDVIRQRMGEDAARMYEWFDRVGFAVDRAALHREFPDIAFHDFESWARAQDWNALLQSA